MSTRAYQKATDAEQAQQEVAKREIEVKLRATVEIAGKCLADPQFIKYRQEFEKLDRMTLRYIEDYPANADPIQDAHQIRAAVNKLGVLRLLLRLVERDNKKKGGV